VQFFLDGNSIGYAPLTARLHIRTAQPDLHGIVTTETVRRKSHPDSTYATTDFATANSNSQSITSFDGTSMRSPA